MLVVVVVVFFIRELLDQVSGLLQHLFSVNSENHCQWFSEHFNAIRASDDESDADQYAKGSEDECNFFHTL